MSLRPGRSGATLLETVVGSAVFVVVMAALFATIKAGQDTIESGSRLSDNTEWSSRVSERIQADLLECSLEHVDTAFRSHQQASPSSDQFANHCWEQIPRLSQCYSPACPWNRPLDGGIAVDRVPQIYCGRSRAVYGTTESVSPYGRIWKGLESSLCPLDGAYASPGADLDAMMLFSPRDESGTFVTDECSEAEALAGLTLAPDWQSIIFYFPYFDGQLDDLQLRRLVVYRRDLLTGDVPGQEYDSWAGGSTAWTDWDDNVPAGQPTLVDLFDFGTDGTTNGAPDGLIPLTPAAADSDSDSFQAYSYAGSGNVVESYLYRYKDLWSVPGSSKNLYLYVDRRTGYVYWAVYFTQGGSSFYRYAAFTRTPEIVVRGLIDCDFSTAVSNPATAKNPNGVGNAATVRVALVFSQDLEIAGEIRNVEHSLDFDVTPRNR